MKRNKYSLSHYKLASFNMGELIPVGVQEVLPGDTLQHATSMLLRVTPLLTPVMHPVSVRIHHWFVPNRLLWSQWEDFITGGPQGTTVVFPTMFVPPVTQPLDYALFDYFGIPPRQSGDPALAVNALPVFAYNLIYNEFYRDQDLTAERASNATTIARVAWQKDYFTTARPWAQKGFPITVPLGGELPVRGLGTQITAAAGWPSNPTGIFETGRDRTNVSYTNAMDVANPSAGNRLYMEGWNSPEGFRPNVRVDAAGISADINSFRRAFAIQRYQEARAQYGSRYTEYLRYLGVRSSDARLQRPEYLGGGKQTIAFSEVLQTGPDAGGDGVANLRGHGISAMRSRRYRRFFEEHGYVISLCSVVPKTIYADNINRTWLRRTKEDFWQRELQHIGQQEISNTEVYGRAGTSGLDAVFGYQDRYAEYRHNLSTISGEFRNVLSDWHFARMFSAQPVLNNSFVQANPPDRPFAEKTQDSLWCMFQHSIQARRMVSSSSVGKLI